MNLQEVKNITQEFLLKTYTPSDVAFVRGEGSMLYDMEGRDYIDFSSGIGVNSVGYAHPQYIQALFNQAQALIHASNLFYNPTQALLAKKLIELSGYDMQVFFANSGAEANEGAIKLARKYGQTHFQKKRYKIITLDSSFHGRTLATLTATGQDRLHPHYFSPYVEGFLVAKNLQEIYKLIDDETCGVMIELIQGEGGIYALPKNEIQKLYAFLQERQVLLIVDEVQSGIYRSGELFASHLYNIIPDIITTAKGLGGGVPIGAVLSKHKDIFEAGDHGSTFGGNYLSTQAGLSVLEILSHHHQSLALDSTIKLFDECLEQILEQYPKHFCQKVGLGLMVGLKATSEEAQKTIISKSLQNGLVLLRSGKNVVRFLPPLLISNKEIKEGFERLKQVLEKI